VDTESPPTVPFGTFLPSERRAMIGCAFAAGCIVLMPGELVGALVAFLLAGGLGLWHLRRSKEERALASNTAETRALPGG
jgi:hypothetical protein